MDALGFPEPDPVRVAAVGAWDAVGFSWPWTPPIPRAPFPAHTCAEESPGSYARGFRLPCYSQALTLTQKDQEGAL